MNNSWHLLDACCAFCLLLKLYLDFLTWSSPRGSDPCIRRKPKHKGPVPVGLFSTWVRDCRSGWTLVPQVNTAFGWTSAEKNRDITLPTKVHLVKAVVFPVVMYEYESLTMKKAERWRIDVFELWCWRRLLRVPWTARRSNQSILKEISPGCSLERLMLKPKLQYFGHLMWRVHSNSCPSSRWCHPATSCSVVPFSSCPQSLPGSFPMSPFFAWGGQSVGASASASVLPMNIHDWFPLGLTPLISLQSKGHSRVFSNTIVQKDQFFSIQSSLWSKSHIYAWLLGKP